MLSGFVFIIHNLIMYISCVISVRVGRRRNTNDTVHRTVGRPAVDRSIRRPREVTETRGAWVQRAHDRRVAYDSISDRVAHVNYSREVCPCTTNGRSIAVRYFCVPIYVPT